MNAERTIVPQKGSKAVVDAMSKKPQKSHKMCKLKEVPTQILSCNKSAAAAIKSREVLGADRQRDICRTGTRSRTRNERIDQLDQLRLGYVGYSSVGGHHFN